MTTISLDICREAIASTKHHFVHNRNSQIENSLMHNGHASEVRETEPRVVLFAEAAGGVMRHVIDLYKGLRAKNWLVRMIVSPLRLEPRYFEELNGLDREDITYVPIKRSPHPTDFIAFSNIRRAVHNPRTAVILHAHSTKAGMIGSLLRPQVRASIFTPHAYRSRDPSLPFPVRSLLRVAERNFSSNYDRVIAVAPGEQDYARNVIGVKENVLRCIPNGLDLDLSQFASTIERRRRINGRICLGFVGRFVHQKNPLLFIDVLAEIVAKGVDARAIVVGDGPMEDEMKARAELRAVAGRIKWQKGEEANGSLREMDIMVHTSFYEACPYSLIEACGDLLPIVATSNDGSKAILDPHMNRNLSSAPDARELASIVLSIAADERLRIHQMQILGNIARQYSATNMVAQTEAEYRALLQ
jgi:glycosyltransferase involved in cell wall biosynthesis